ncbi:unnamed protein product [Scytosiphon promiscuus]
MELSEALEGCCGATWNLLPFLRWRDIVSVASASTRLFLPVRNVCQRLRSDVSCGDSPYPIPCDPVHDPLLSVQQVPSPPGCSSGVPRRSNWSLGGPVPPSFSYLNDANHDLEDAEDLLEGCACFGGCDDANLACPCVQLNKAVESGPVPLFECHADCSCALTCRLRATQRGASKNIRLRFMGSKGWGAYAVDTIPGGVYVADYTGEVLSVLEARRRVPAYDKDGLNYVLTTQEFFQGGQQVCQTIVDATAAGNVSRFFNHSCEPTLSVFVIRRGSFLRPRLAFFTRDQVEAGRELTYDYGATGSAGGTAPQVPDRESDGNSGTPRQQQPTTKPPRKSGAPAQAESTSSGELPPKTRGVLPVEDKEISQVGKTGEIGRQLWTARASDSGEGSDHGLAPSARRACLCGSQQCRGLLPCNRAIL